MKTFFRIVIGIPVVTTFIISLIFIGLGVKETIHGLLGVLRGEVRTDTRPGLHLFEALDVFLIGFLFLIFSIGLAHLFFPKPSKIMTRLDGFIPQWLKVESFSELKLILWDTVLTTLVFLFIGDMFIAAGNYRWELLLTPAAILMISVSKFLLKKAKKL